MFRIGVLIPLEGVSRLALLVADLRPSRQLTERAHSDYDTLLGWINQRNASVPDLCRPGLGLHTHSRWFRGREDVSDSVAPTHVRIACSGDSYTIGWGAGDEDT